MRHIIDTFRMNKTALVLVLIVALVAGMICASPVIAGANTGNPYTNGDLVYHAGIDVWQLRWTPAVTLTDEIPYAPPPSWNLATSVLGRIGYPNLGWGISAFSGWWDYSYYPFTVSPASLPTTFHCIQYTNTTPALNTAQNARFFLDRMETPSPGVYVGYFKIVIDPPSGEQQFVAAVAEASVTWTDYGRIDVQKISANTTVTSGNSNYSLAGAVFSVYNNSGATGTPVTTMTTNATGYAQTGLLPPGSYWVKETTAPTGYIASTTIWPVAVVGGTTWRVNSTTWGGTGNVANTPMQGRIDLVKRSANPSITDNNACYSLAGAIYSIYTTANASGTPVATLTTRSDGTTAPTALLPFRTYYVKETTPAPGYALDPTIYIVVVGGTQHDRTFRVNQAVGHVIDMPHHDPTAVWAYKLDNETADGQPQSGKRLEGALFEIKYYDMYFSVESTTTIANATPKRTWIIRTGDRGGAYLGEEFLMPGSDPLYYYAGDAAIPLGTVTIQEIQAPEGYILDPTLHIREVTAEDRSFPQVHTYNPPLVPNNLIRGDIELIKVEQGTRIPLPNISFSITSTSTGESYIIVTNDEGFASTASSHNLHSQNTNQGLTSEDGVWFGLDADNNPIPVNDDLGALPYGRYVVAEIANEPSAPWTLLDPIEVEITEHGETIVLGELSNEKVEIATQIRKFTISRTSAAFVDDTPTGTVDNVEKERQLYHIHYRDRSSHYVDELVLVDPLEAVRDGGQRLEKLWTPISVGDYDGLMNVWYQTNLQAAPFSLETTRSSDGVISAMKTNPFNPHNPDQLKVLTPDGWRIWAQDVRCDERRELSVEDLGLAEGEYITGLMFEHGRVEPSAFTTSEDIDWDDDNGDISTLDPSTIYGDGLQLQPITYQVYYIQENEKEFVVVNSTRIDEARNLILKDRDDDIVETRFMDTFAYASGTGAMYAEREISELPGRQLAMRDAVRVNALTWWLLAIGSLLVTVALMRSSDIEMCSHEETLNA